MSQNDPQCVRCHSFKADDRNDPGKNENNCTTWLCNDGRCPKDQAREDLSVFDDEDD